MCKSALKNLTNKRGNITLTVVILLAAILITIGTGLILMTVNSLSILKSGASYTIAKTRAESCIEESLSRIKNDNTFQNTVNLNFSDGSQCTSAVSNLPPGDTSNKAKSLKVAALYNGYNYEVTRTVSVLGANNVISAITWQQSDPSTDAVDDKNSALNLAYTSTGFSKGAIDSSSNYSTLLSYKGSASSASILDYKISSTNMSSLIVSADMVNTLDTQTRVASIQYSTDNGNTFNSINGSTCTTGGSTTTNSTCSFASTSSNPTNVAGTITFSNSFGGNVIVRFNLSGAGGGSEQVGIKTISFSPTSNTFDFIPRTGSINIEGIVPNSIAGSAIAGGTGNTDVAGIFVQNNYAYVVNHGNNRLDIFDVSNPTAPVLRGNVTTANNPTDVYVVGNYAYLSIEGDDGIQVINVSNPASPVAYSVVVSGGNENSIYVQGKYAYLTSPFDNSLKIFDISNATTPVLVSSLSGFTGARQVKVVGNIAYVGSTNGTTGTLITVNISNPLSPSILGTVAIGNIETLSVQERYVYIADHVNENIQIVDVSNPSSPSLVSTTPVVGLSGDPGPYGVFVQGNYLYAVMHDDNTIEVWDISNPSASFSKGKFVLGTNIIHQRLNISVKGRYAYIANGNENKLQILDLGGAYIQQLEAGGLEANTLTLNGNLIGRDANLIGAASIGQSLLVNGDSSFNGNLSANSNLNLKGNFTQTSGISTITSNATTGTAFSLIANSLIANGTGMNISSTATNIGSGDLLSLNAASMTTGTGIYANFMGATTLFSLDFGVSRSLTTGGLIRGCFNSITNTNGTCTSGTPYARYVHTTAETGSLFDLRLEDGSTLTSSTSTSNGASIPIKITTTGAGTKTINGYTVPSVTLTSCTSGACTINGFNTTTATSGALSTVTQNGLNIAATGIAAGTLNGINISNITAGAGTETGLLIGSGWDSAININSNKFKVDGNGNLFFGTSGSSIDFASATNGNNFIMKIPQNATTTLCASAAAEGLIIKTTGNTQVGHLCIDGPTSATPNKLRYYAEQFNATSTDIAENYSDKTNTLKAGDIVVLDSSTYKGVKKATISGDNSLIGIVSSSPGITLTGIDENQKTDLINPKPIALSGRVPVNVTTKNGVIHSGDFITSSDIPGVGQKNTQRGFIVGKALEDYTESDTNKIGQILIFVNTIYYMPTTISSNDSSIAYFEVSGNSLITSFALNTKEGITSKSLQTGAITALDIKSQCTDSNNSPLYDQNACSAFAQKYETSEKTEAGDLVEINLTNPQKLQKTQAKQSKLVVGVVTENAGVTLGLNGAIQTGGNLLSEITDTTTIVGFAGKTITKVNGENGDIKIGDAITSSSTPGVGMKANSGDPVIGIALENYIIPTLIPNAFKTVSYDNSNISKIIVLLNKNIGN